MKHLTVHFSGKYCSDYLPALGNLLFDSCIRLRTYSRESAARIRGDILALAEAYLSAGQYYELECHAKLDTLVLDMLRYLPHSTMSGANYLCAKNIMERTGRVLDYLEDHYQEVIRLRDLAEMEGVSASHMSHCFKEMTGVPFSEYLMRLRLSRARQMMSNPAERLTDICIASGFSDYRYLSRAFRLIMNCTPGEYRSSILARNGEKRSEPDGTFSADGAALEGNAALELLRRVMERNDWAADAAAEDEPRRLIFREEKYGEAE